jgi:hypothetical protein
MFEGQIYSLRGAFTRPSMVALPDENKDNELHQVVESKLPLINSPGKNHPLLAQTMTRCGISPDSFQTLIPLMS